MKRPLAVLSTALLAAAAAIAVPASASAAPNGFTSTTRWVNNTVTVVYSWDGLAPGAVSGSLDLKIGEDTIVSDGVARIDRIAHVARGAERGTAAHLTGTVTECATNPDPAATDPVCTTVQVLDTVLHRHLVRATRTQTSAAVLLSGLRVRNESHVGSYTRSRFKLWVDANHDRESTRAEVLKAESTKKVTISRTGIVKTGRWVSPYDGKVYIAAAKLDIDHMVPLEEAWASGAWTWSAKKREAYANDLGYGASLVAVSAHENRSKGDKEPGQYLPPRAGDRCAYVRNWIGVKSRWNLTLDKGERATLITDLALYCADPYVAKPGVPNLAKLVESPLPRKTTPKPKPKPKPTLDPRYGTCTELLKHPNHAPYVRGVDAEYAWYQDRDHDGLVCE